MSAEPRTRAGRALLEAGFYLAHPQAKPDPELGRKRLRSSILIIEAEAAGDVRR